MKALKLVHIMKKSLKEYIEIVLTIAIIAGLFMPYVYGVLPIDVIIGDSIELWTVFALTIPILVTIPFLLILIFKDVLSHSLLKTLKVFFLILYSFVFVVYCSGFYESFSNEIEEIFEFLITIILSLLLLFLALRFSNHQLEQLQNIFLAIMSFPFILYFIYGITNNIDAFNYGGYIISISFFTLYIIAIFTIYKNRKEKQLNKKIIDSFKT
jgi:hypothetical protein